jgi:hypothetical protein
MGKISGFEIQVVKSVDNSGGRIDFFHQYILHHSQLLQKDFTLSSQIGISFIHFLCVCVCVSIYIYIE